jgi:hypothetical protein
VAKKKSRVPTPPKRPVQAPRPYRAPRDPRRTRIAFIAVAAAIVLAAGGVGIAMAVGSGGGGGDTESEVCTTETFPPMGRQHVRQLRKGFEYNSFPPTSGPHDPVPAIWNVYDRPVPEIKLVHNLEHGGVIVQYGRGVSQETVREIVDWYADDPRGLIVAPLPKLGDKIAVSAWTHLMTCSEFDKDAFGSFVDDHRGPDGDAPEEFPLDALQPGST